MVLRAVGCDEEEDEPLREKRMPPRMKVTRIPRRDILLDLFGGDS